jgi:hypothetical protein
MMNDNLYISSFLMQRREEEKKVTSVIFQSYTVCPIANGSSLKCGQLSQCEIESNPYSITCCCRRQMDCLTDDDACDGHSSMDNFASSITQMLSKGREEEEEKNKKLDHVITAVFSYVYVRKHTFSINDRRTTTTSLN